MADVPAWIQRARDGWSYHGQSRPSFAEAVGPGQESVWDYPRPPRLAPDSREVIIRSGEAIIASTRGARRVLETASPPTFYLPRQDIRMDLLRAVGGGSLCEWKGAATYYSVVVPGATLRNAAWSYDDPFPEFQDIAGWISFYPGQLECFVDGERVQPQPGGLYGGWITSDVAGPFKGNPGTEGW